MEIQTAQAELRSAYLLGGPGAVVSGIVWLLAGLAASFHGVAIGFAVLFFGGMLIFPISAALVRFLFRRPAVTPGNPGGTTVVETVFPMIAGLLAAWLILPHRPEFVFPLAAIAVGAHYFGFRTAYGAWIYWVLGAVMCAVGLVAIFVIRTAPDTVAFVIAGIEVAFGLAFTALSLRQSPSASTSA
jgi:hypothetical protein